MLSLQNMVYDLGDATLWEFFFPNVDKPLLVVPGEEPKMDQEEEDQDDLEVHACMCSTCHVMSRCV